MPAPLPIRTARSGGAIYLLNIVNPNHTFKQKLENLFLKYPNVDRAAMGFPANWENEPLWAGQ